MLYTPAVLKALDYERRRSAGSDHYLREIGIQSAALKPSWYFCAMPNELFHQNELLVYNTTTRSKEVFRPHRMPRL